MCDEKTIQANNLRWNTR